MSDQIIRRNVSTPIGLAHSPGCRPLSLEGRSKTNTGRARGRSGPVERFAFHSTRRGAGNRTLKKSTGSSEADAPGCGAQSFSPRTVSTPQLRVWCADQDSLPCPRQARRPGRFDDLRAGAFRESIESGPWGRTMKRNDDDFRASNRVCRAKFADAKIPPGISVNSHKYR